MATQPKISFGFGNIDPNSPTKPFQWEEFQFDFWRNWMADNFQYSVVVAGIYVLLVFLGQVLMKNKPSKRFKTVLPFWNFGFAVFSLVAFVRTAPDLWYSITKPNGFYQSVCSSQGQSVPFAFWSWIGTFSKVVELGDTAFLVLRKNKVIFLHWFHHATAMLYTWYVFEAQEPCHRWLMVMNFFIHVIMYSYFGLKAVGINLPKWFAMIITSLQIVQMVIGVYVNYYTWKALNEGMPCDRSRKNLKIAFVMYFCYLILFMNFFVNSYFKRKRVEKLE